MHALAAQGSEQKRKACINFTQMNLFSKTGIVMEIHCHIAGICEPPMSSSLFSVILFMIFQSIVIPIHNKFPKFVCQRD